METKTKTAVIKVDKKNKTEVVIGGKVYTLAGAESTEHIQNVARYIDKKLAEINKLKGSHPINASLFPIVLALNVGDDYFKEMEVSNALREQITQMEKDEKNHLRTQQDDSKELQKARQEAEQKGREAKKLRQELEFAKAELIKAKTELKDYIETFGKK